MIYWLTIPFSIRWSSILDTVEGRILRSVSHLGNADRHNFIESYKQLVLPVVKPVLTELDTNQCSRTSRY